MVLERICPVHRLGAALTMRSHGHMCFMKLAKVGHLSQNGLSLLSCSAQTSSSSHFPSCHEASVWPQHDVFIILCFSSYTGPPTQERLQAPQNQPLSPATHRVVHCCPTFPLMVLTAAVLAHPLLGEFSLFFSSLFEMYYQHLKYIQ